MFVFYSVHYPQPEKEELWGQQMRQFDELIKKQPGIIFVNTFKDPENGTLIALAIWESEEAFQASWPILAKDAPSEEWETRPREVHLLYSAV